MNETWYFSVTEYEYSENVELSRIECEAMVESKMCNNKQMQCDYESCIHIGKFEFSTFQWNQRIRQETYDCKVKKIAILTDKLDKPLFNSHSGNCRANSLQCKLYDSIIIWNQSIINSCDMSIIKMGYNYTFRNNILYSQEDKLLFELTDPEINCNVKTYKTTDNLYIAFHR